MYYFSCLAAFDTTSSSWATVANDSSYASYSVLSVATDNQFVAIGNIHGALKIMCVSSLLPLCKFQAFLLTECDYLEYHVSRLADSVN